MKTLSAAASLLGLALAGCAHLPATSQMVLPAEAEIAGYVGAHWAADFSWRFNRFAGREGRSSELLSVQNSHCDLTWSNSVAECSYDVVAKFSDGEIVTRQFWSEFERASDGSLEEVLIIWHVRKR